LHSLLDLGVFALRGVVACLEVLGEEARDELPEIGGEAALVGLDDLERVQAAFAVDQAHQHEALGDGHLADVLLEEPEELALHVLDVAVALGAAGRVGGDRAVHCRIICRPTSA
jgi:hypothetical protein